MSFDCKEKLLHTGILWLRILAGVGIAHHGYGKVFGGYMGQLTEGVTQMGFPMPVFFAWAAAFSEFLGGILLVLGLGTRIAALFVFITMAVAAFIVHRENSLDVKELALAYWTISGALMLIGPGQWSLDYLLTKKNKF